MRVLICTDDGQLRRVEQAIAAIESGSPHLQQTRQSLLTALENERAELLRYSPTKRRHQQRFATAA